jgi:hypothetical protein
VAHGQWLPRFYTKDFDVTRTVRNIRGVERWFFIGKPTVEQLKTEPDSDGEGREVKACVCGESKAMPLDVQHQYTSLIQVTRTT